MGPTPPSAAPTALEPPPRPGAAWALTILTVLNVLNYVDRFVVAAILPDILRDLRISDTEGGISQSIFIFSYALVSPIVGVLGDRRRRIPLAVGGVVVWSLATAASGLAPTYATFLVARALTGVGEACYAVVTPSLLSDLYPPSRRGRVMAIFYAAIPVGSALGYILGGQLGSADALGWRNAMMVVGAPGALLGLALVLVREPARGAMDAVGDAASAVAPPPAPQVPWRDAVRALAARKSYLFNTTAQTMYAFAIGGLGAWMPTYFVRARNIPLSQAATIFGGLLVVAGFVGTLAGGRLGDRLARVHRDGHFRLAGITLLVSLPFSALAVLAPWPAVFWPSMFLTLLLLFMNTGPLNAAMVNVLPSWVRARGFALYSLTIHVLGDGISPTIIGAASDRIGLALPVLSLGILVSLAGVVLLAGRPALVRDLTHP